MSRFVNYLADVKFAVALAAVVELAVAEELAAVVELADVVELAVAAKLVDVARLVVAAVVHEEHAAFVVVDNIVGVSVAESAVAESIEVADEQTGSPGFETHDFR